ncbi:MAG: 3-oxoacyl-ACP reductase [Gammaproteobacteria bacterium TMED78]|nr:MAG: 3-oxoacyl-ACP reductase [Gammaproteobacteria bacterium TMED78]|tara:strand:+ start:48689 stop:49462 length:774 start_codon:yes stop_codon:yes gene_type:complete
MIDKQKNKSPYGLDGEVALITGASRGIGRSICITLASQGAVVIGSSTSKKGSESISNYLKELGLKGRGVELELNDHENIERLFKDIINNEGYPTIVVNNAGITRDGLLMRMKPDEWNDVISTNLTSIYWISKASIRGMLKEKKGRIINISSVVGVTGNPGQTNYSAAKAGIIGFTKSLSRELASRNITVNCVAPGYIKTDMTEMISESIREDIISNIPLLRLGNPEDVASAVLFLSSDAASYITGETLNINGGLAMI